MVSHSFSGGLNKQKSASQMNNWSGILWFIKTNIFSKVQKETSKLFD